jgi:hypothetical protein
VIETAFMSGFAIGAAVAGVIGGFLIVGLLCLFVAKFVWILVNGL